MLPLLARFYPYIAGVALLLAVTVWIYMRGYHDCQSKAALAVIKEDNAHDKIEQKVNAVPDSALDKRLSRWVLKP
jgi:hypothetical protein